MALPINFRETHWILIILFCAAAGIYSWYYFPTAFPILDVEVAMDRHSAITRAREIARERDLGPSGFNLAASFSQDNEVQTFVELEAGGKDAFRNMMRTGRYHPFQWHVRLYREGESRETLVRFKPTGEVYGFKEKWPESVEGPVLAPEKARRIAEKRATENWGIDLSKYQFLSSGEQERSSGRVDHTFLYERKDVDVGDGEYRLRLGVSGDQLSEVTHYVHVPQGFTRRYQNMRSANNLIKSTGNIFVYVVYLLIGGFFGCYWLLTRDALKWRTAFVWGAGITLLLFLARINSLPLSWMEYDTAMSTGAFLSRRIVNALSSSLIFGVIITISFISAEGLTRMAFGHHPKLWQTWNPEVAGSKTVSSLTVFGYLLLGPYFAYNIALYGFAHESLGWWTPSNILYNPNILAHYATWLKPVVNSLRAGFWEECLFRAVPLAGAALLGNRYGRRNWWIGITLVLQALVFGAGHASYATQPSYARVVELFFSSIGLGLIYLGYGLLPTVIVHYLYDLILMSIPIFVSTAPGILFSQTVVVLLGSVPLLVVLAGRLYNGEWIVLPDRYFNRSRSTARERDSADRTVPVLPELSWQRTLLVVLAGLSALGIWYAYGSFETYETPLRMTREPAVRSARTTLEDTGESPSDWMVGSYVSGGVNVSDRFVWHEGGPDAYRKLMGSYLTPPHWTVRYFTFEGSLVKRAEEYRVRLAPEADYSEIEHVLPKSSEGDSLSESEARVLADSAIISRYGYEPDELKKISAEPQPRPKRRDWTFEYGVPGEYPLEKGEARVRVRIAGSEVTESSRYVHVPESWKRDHRSRQKVIELIGSSADTVLYLIGLVGAFAGLVFWGRGWGFDLKTFLVVLVGFIVLTGAETVNRWPRILATFSTAEPYWSQVVTVLTGRILYVVWAGVLGLIAGFTHANIGRNTSGSTGRSLLVGLSLGAVAVALLTLTSQLTPNLVPEWGHYGSLSQAFPLLHHSIGAVKKLVTGTVMLLLFAAAVHRVSRGGREHSTWTVAGIVLFGFLIGSNGGFVTFAGWAVKGVLYAGLFVLAGLYVFPYDRSFVPAAVGSFIVLGKIKTMIISVHPFALWSPLLAIVIVLVLSGYWTLLLNRRQTTT